MTAATSTEPTGASATDAVVPMSHREVLEALSG